MDDDGPVGVVDGFREWLGGVDVGELDDRERVELVAALERVKGAACATQARATDALRCSREVVAPQDVGRSVGSVVALARRESPSAGDRLVGLARALVHEMPCTMAALSAGATSERVTVAVVQATATLSREDRAEVDRRLGPVIDRLGWRQAGRAAMRVAAELDAASVVARMEAAVRSRRVTVRPAPDGMAYLSVLGPLTDVVGAHAALQARARGVVGGQCPGEAPDGRGVGAVAADTALRLLSGRGAGELTPVEVHLVMTDRALLGSGDGNRSVVEPARIPGHGSIPAPVARAWLRKGLDEFEGATGDGAAARVWLRRLYTSPDGQDLVAMDSRRRVFGGLLRRMLVLRDDVCTTPWCEAPIVHADHTVPVRQQGRTRFVDGSGKCARCNQVKEAPGWRARVIPAGHCDATDKGPPGRQVTGNATGGRSARGSGEVVGTDDSRGSGRRVVQITTPLGHHYRAEPPPLLGWGSDTPPQQRVATSTDGPPGRVMGGSVGDGQIASRRQGPPRRASTAGDVARAGEVERPSHRAKRPLGRRRARGCRPTSRRPRLTSSLERQLCRYLG